jgi:hypothetical protein
MNNRCFVNHHKQVFPPALLQDMKQYLYEVMESKNSGDKTDREVTAIGRGEGSDSLRMDVRWYEIWKSHAKSLQEAIAPYTWVIFPVQVRMVREPHHQVPWHQDLAFQNAIGARGHKEIITCFVPLDEDPFNRATVQYSPVSSAFVEHMPMGGFNAGTDLEFEDVFHCRLQSGDCLLFGDLAFHRTYVPEGAAYERNNLEFRLCKPSGAVPGKDYFDTETGRFVMLDGVSPLNG